MKRIFKQSYTKIIFFNKILSFYTDYRYYNRIKLLTFNT